MEEYLSRQLRKKKKLRKYHQHKDADHLRLATNFEENTAMIRLGIVNSFGSSFNLRADTMIITGRESIEIVQSMKGDWIIQSIVAKSSGIAGDIASCHIIWSLCTNQETITTNNSVGSESGTLQPQKKKSQSEENETCQKNRTLKTSRVAWECTPDCL